MALSWKSAFSYFIRKISEVMLLTYGIFLLAHMYPGVGWLTKEECAHWNSDVWGTFLRGPTILFGYISAGFHSLFHTRLILNVIIYKWCKTHAAHLTSSHFFFWIEKKAGLLKDKYLMTIIEQGCVQCEVSLSRLPASPDSQGKWQQNLGPRFKELR